MTAPDDLSGFGADQPGPSAQARLLARSELDRAIDARAHRPTGIPQRGPARSGSRRRWGLRAGAVAVALAAVTAVALLAPWGSGRGGPDTAAAAALDQAARSARRSPVAAAAAGRYVHVRITARWAVTDVSSGVTYLQDQVSQTWTPTTGVGTAVHRETTGRYRFLNPGDAARLRGAQPTAAGQTTTFTYAAVDGSFADPSESFTAGLPTDVGQLYDQVRSAAGGDTGAAGQRMLIDVGNVLGVSVAPPALRSALYQVVTRIPGVRLVADTTDYTGRRGTTVAITVAGDEQDLIFDAATGQLLGQREVVRTARAGIPAGTVIGWSSFQTSLVATAPTL